MIRKIYKKPALAEYGNVAEITQWKNKHGRRDKWKKWDKKNHNNGYSH